MYREQAEASVLQGVESGRYTGGARRVDAELLPAATRRRLEAVLAGSAEPSPLLRTTPARPPLDRGALALMLVGLAGLGVRVALAAAESDAPTPLWTAGTTAIWLVSTLAIGIGATFAWPRRRGGGLPELPGGRYLFPLDLVEIPAHLAGEPVALTVTPLGDVRDARVRARGGPLPPKEELVLRTVQGSEIVLALASPAERDEVLRRLALSQRLLEAVTFNRDLEKAHAQDVFFDLRVDDSWSAVEPRASTTTTGSTATPALAPEQTWLSELRASSRRAAAPGGWLALALGAGVAVGALQLAGFLADRGRYVRAVRRATPAALDAYLADGKAYRAEAFVLREQLAKQEAELLATKEAAAATSVVGTRALAATGFGRGEWELAPAELEARRAAVEACVGSLETLRTPDEQGHGPHGALVMSGLVRRASRLGAPIVPVRFSTRLEPSSGEVPPSDHEAREEVFVSAMERVLSDSCPAALVRFARQEPRVDPENETRPGIDVALRMSWPVLPTWTLTPSPRRYQCPGEPDPLAALPCPPGGRLPIHARTYRFDVTIRETYDPGPVTFSLTMRPPPQPRMTLRPRSLFRIAGPPAPDGTFDDRIHAALSARAYDELYDQLYAWLFAGEPRVPL